MASLIAKVAVAYLVGSFATSVRCFGQEKKRDNLLARTQKTAKTAFKTQTNFMNNVVMLSARENWNKSLGFDGITLIQAVLNEDCGRIEALIRAGADVNFMNWKGETPLILAAENGHLKIVELLIREGVKVNNKKGQKALKLAAKNRHYKVVETLLRAGADVNIADKWGKTALIRACDCYGEEEEKNSEIVNVLLRAGANVNVTNRWGATPLILAAEQGHPKIVELLIRAGAKLEAANALGDTPLILAAKYGYLTVAELLIRAGAKVNNVMDVDMSFTPLMWAAYNGHFEIVKLLLREGKADVNVATVVYGITPLMIASTKRHLKIVEELINWGADVTAVDKYGNTASKLASMKEYHEIVDLLDG